MSRSTVSVPVGGRSFSKSMMSVFRRPASTSRFMRDVRRRSASMSRSIVSISVGGNLISKGYNVSKRRRSSCECL